MLINKIKKCKPIDYDSKLKEYLIKNNDKSCYTDKIKEFFDDLSKNRNEMTKMKEVQKTIEEIRENIKIIVSYVNKINLLKKKMVFGKDKFCCKLNFDWYDTINGSHIKSHDIEFELDNCLFNLAILYYCGGLVLAGSEAQTKELRKESTNNFKRAIYVFNIIKEEAKQKINQKEMPSELHESHIDYCISLCEIEGQIQIYKIAKETNPKDFELHSKLLLAISNLYHKASEVTKNMQNKKGAIDNMGLYFENRAIYYKAAMCKDLKNENKKIFDERGEKYGEVVFYQNLYVKQLTECQKTIGKLGKFLNIESLTKELEDAKTELKEEEDLNNRIYHQALPNEDNLVFDTKNMMKEKSVGELYVKDYEYKLKEDEDFKIPELDLLAPKEVRDMFGRYRPKINKIISETLDQYENEVTISNFIQNLHLPKKLTKKVNNDGEDDENNEGDFYKHIPDELWEKINKIQQIGGPAKLINIMNGIMKKSNYLINNLNNILHSFEAEDRDDSNCRMQYRERWTRPPSQSQNYQMVQGAQQYIASINKTKEYDKMENDDIMKNSQYFERLMNPKEKLNENIPHEEEVKTEDTPEEIEIKDEIAKLHELCDKCTKIIRSIFVKLNDDSVVITQFLDVLSKKTTEQVILDKNKDSFQSLFDELKNLSDEVKKQKGIINETIKKNYEKLPKMNTNNNDGKVIEYYRNLDQLANMFMAKYDKIMKGDKYYNDLNEKIEQFLKACNGWMINRGNEKNNMIRNLNGN